MKITHIQHPYVPGLGYQENYLPSLQKKLGHEVTIISSNSIPSKFDKNKDVKNGQFYYKDVKTYRLKMLIHINSMGKVILRGMKKTLSKINPDVIHAHGIVSLTTLQALRYCKKNDCKLFVDCHIDNDNFHLDYFYKNIGFSFFNNMLLPDLINNTKCFLPVNIFARNFLLNEFEIPGKQIKLLPLGVDTGIFYPNCKYRAHIRNKLNIKEDEILLIHSGNFESTKDIDVLVKAFAKIKKERDDVKLLLLGKGKESYMKKIRKLINEKNIEDSVIIHDFVDHSKLSAYYNAADLGVYPGKLGITIIEAVGTGLPVIVSNSKATNHIISNDNGFSIERGNVETLTEKILRYMQDKNLREKHKENAIELVKNELSWKNIAEKSIQIYKKFS